MPTQAPTGVHIALAREHRDLGAIAGFPDGARITTVPS
jgi:hypothetical protein